MIIGLSERFWPVPIARSVNGGLQYYAQPVSGVDFSGEATFYRLLLAIWQLRSADLQAKFPLDTLDSRLDFLAWVVVHGRAEYASIRDLAPLWRELAQPAKVRETPWSGGISRFMVLVARARPDLTVDPALDTERGQYTLQSWFWLHGVRELGVGHDDIPEWQRRFLAGHLAYGLSRYQFYVYAAHGALRRAFELSTPEGQRGFQRWWVEKAAEHTTIGLIFPEAGAVVPVAQTSVSVPGSLPFGVNLVGYAFGELGIGEDVRMAARALQAAGVPFTVIDFAPGADISQGDRSIADWVGDEPVYGINIVCTTAMEQVRLFAERGASLFEGRYTIGYWPWELERWPANWEHCFSLADEVWSSSEHTRRAAEAVSPVPVLAMPMAVSLPKVTRSTRKRHGLPADDYLFVFSFDGKSGLARKNPLAVVRAFARAFPKGDEPVGLVIKCMRPDTTHDVWQTLSAAAASDPRIHIIDKVLSKAQVLGFYALCDAFVSLHRAEGYGRGIAEALLLGLEVVVTGYSGNLDFCTWAGAQLVPYRMVPVAAGDYVEADGQSWAEPDERAAARAMRRLARRKAHAKPVDGDLLSESSVGRRYRQRLERIQAMLGAVGKAAGAPDGQP